ncbi:hypothetical protein N5C89_16525 [Klebsiella michiganensis]|uniref:Uncharacterized protein n=1 Tax=Klebsiella michiganensis TaxID=1134687 RepID=A0AAJ1KT90_9ENTR|nr:hypothetical protein [Klebsiella michiganensis]MDH0964444.1 hypothetical protein [Klebsiella michiganensis]
MNNSKHFNSQIQELDHFANDCSNEEIKNEPMFFNCDLNFAWDNGGNITRSFISNLPLDWQQDEGIVFDSRVHMLMPGWYPAIPGFHHDDVPRPDIPVGQHFIAAGQPDYDNPRYLSEHILGLVNADICPTNFAIGKCEMPQIPDGELIYRRWHQEVLSLIERGEMERVTVRDRTLTAFDWQTFHSGDKAIQNGWRWFGRVSRNTDRVRKITNEIRVNAQVYLEFPMQGW